MREKIKRKEIQQKEEQIFNFRMDKEMKKKNGTNRKKNEKENRI